MSLQDDIFDVQDALKRKPEARKQFDRLINHMNYCEVELEKEQNIVRDIKRGVKAVLALIKE